MKNGAPVSSFFWIPCWTPYAPTRGSRISVAAWACQTLARLGHDEFRPAELVSVRVLTPAPLLGYTAASSSVPGSPPSVGLQT